MCFQILLFNLQSWSVHILTAGKTTIFLIIGSKDIFIRSQVDITDIFEEKSGS